MQDRTKHFVDMSGIHAYHMSNSPECMGVDGEALQLHTVYKKPYFYYSSSENPYQYYKSHENPYEYCNSCENQYQVLQITYAASERAMKSKVPVINHYHHSTKLYRKKYHSYFAVGIVTCAAHSTIQTATNS